MVTEVTGGYVCSVDQSNRFILPAKWRSDMGKDLIMVQDIALGSWLIAMTKDGWDKYSERFAKIQHTDKKAMALLRIIYASLYSCKADSQWRVTIPPALKEFAGISDEVYLLGASNRFELWNRKKWEAYTLSVYDDPDTHVSEYRSRIGTGPDYE